MKVTESFLLFFVPLHPRQTYEAGKEMHSCTSLKRSPFLDIDRHILHYDIHNPSCPVFFLRDVLDKACPSILCGYVVNWAPYQRLHSCSNLVMASCSALQHQNVCDQRKVTFP